MVVIAGVAILSPPSTPPSLDAAGAAATAAEFKPGAVLLEGVYDGGIAERVAAALAFSAAKRDICTLLRPAAAPAGVGSVNSEGE